MHNDHFHVNFNIVIIIICMKKKKHKKLFLFLNFNKYVLFNLLVLLKSVYAAFTNKTLCIVVCLREYMPESNNFGSILSD